MLGLILLCLQRALARNKEMCQADSDSLSAATNSSTVSSASPRRPTSQPPQPRFFLIRPSPSLADTYASTNASSAPTPTRTFGLTRTFLITIHHNRARASSTADHDTLPIVTELSSSLSSCNAQVTTLQDMMSLYSQGHEHLSNDLFSCTGTISSLGSASAAFVTPTITETVTRTTTMTPTSGQESISHSYTMPPVSFNTFDAHWPILFPLVLSPVLAIWALSLTTWEQQSDRLLIRKIMIPSAISFLCFGGTLGISFHGTASSPPSAWASVILNSVAFGCMTVAICGWKRFATMGPACGKLSLRQTAKARTPYTPQGKHTRETSQTTLAPPRELKPQPEPKLEGKTARQLSSSRLFPTARQVLACVSVVEQRQIDRLPQRDRVAAYEKVISRHLLHHTQRHGTDWEACSDAAVKAPLATPPPPMARASKETPPPYGMVPKPHGNQPPFPSYGMNLASEAGENPMLYSIMLKPEAKAPLVTPSPPQARGLIGDREPRVIASLTRPVATRQEVAPENIPLPPESPAERSYQTSPRGPLTLKNYPSTRSSGRSPSPEIATPPQTTTDLDWEVDDLVQQTISELDLDVYRSETLSPKLIDYEQERRDQEAWEEAEEEDCRRWEEGDTEASRLLDNWDYLLESHPETLQ